MQVKPIILNSAAAMPVAAALPYAVAISEVEARQSLAYDPEAQLSCFEGRSDSTCANDESVGFIFTSQTDWSQDD